RIRVFGDQRRKVSDFLYRELKLNPPSIVQGIYYYDIAHNSEELKQLEANHVLLVIDPGLEEQTVTVKKNIRGNIYKVNQQPWLSYSAWGHNQILDEALALLT